MEEGFNLPNLILIIRGQKLALGGERMLTTQRMSERDQVTSVSPDPKRTGEYRSNLPHGPLLGTAQTGGPVRWKGSPDSSCLLTFVVSFLYSYRPHVDYKENKIGVQVKRL